MRKLWSFLLGISPLEASFDRRGFRSGDSDTQRRLELAGREFLRGYHAALDKDDVDELAGCLFEGEPETRGFAFEGAAMALGLLDSLTPWKRNRFRLFLKGPGASHPYMLHVGLGWAWARLPVSPNRCLARLDPLLGWLAIDGYGFHEGYFNWRKYRSGRRTHPRLLKGYAARVFDQGLGRSLWFVESADPAHIAADISALDPSRHADLWSGVGLACAYAGRLNLRGLEELQRVARGFAGELAQGAAFAAKTRQRAGNPAAHTELACNVLCGMTASQAAAVTDEKLLDLSATKDVPGYEIWRQRIQSEFARLRVQEVTLT